MTSATYEIGMVGLGVMGRNLLLNMADNGYSVAGYDLDKTKVEALRREAETRDIRGAESLAEFASMLRSPRAVMMLVPAGPPVDGVIKDLLPHLARGDLIIDGGNSYFKDTDLRTRALAEKGILYMGVGVSGGEQGARHGPSIMPGGSREAYERVRPVLEAVAAKADGEPCVTYLGGGSAGHYVKMVHNGIEYGLLELIAETYDLLRRGLGLSDNELHTVFDTWNRGELNGYLIEITADIFCRGDELATGKRLIDSILDEAKQKGTGKWTSQDAMDLQVPVPTLDIAVAMRDLSAFKTEREAAARLLGGPPRKMRAGRGPFLRQLNQALYAAMVITYAQGMVLLLRASHAYEYGLNLEDVARIWRAGCIIRSTLLDDIRAAYRAQPTLANLLVDSHLGRLVTDRQEALRGVVKRAVQLGIPAPGLAVSLNYFDGYRSDWLPANLIQAQRDYFGAHTYERVDMKGVFHTQWQSE
ncbi:MAG TPA: NADP-dependent phosphogluconate dehydrogenase [Syntrophorhabdales bacterium]|nr:NADP-dependent phosphogluconate dehydrogenase [Syntrophorhabdales bacterium]